jgi:hypothetical protein
MDTLGVDDDQRIRDEIATIVGQIKFFLNGEPYKINIHTQIDEIQAEYQALALGPQRLPVRKEEVVRAVLNKHLNLLADKKPSIREKLPVESVPGVVDEVIAFLWRTGHIKRDGVPPVVMLSAAPVDDEIIDLELEDRPSGVQGSKVEWIRAGALNALGVLVQHQIRGVAALIAAGIVLFVILCLGDSIAQPYLNLLRLALVALATYGVYQVVNQKNRVPAAWVTTTVLGGIVLWWTLVGFGGFVTKTPPAPQSAVQTTVPVGPAKTTPASNVPATEAVPAKVVQDLVEIIKKKEEEGNRKDGKTERLENRLEQQQLELHDLQTKLELLARAPAKSASPAPVARTAAKPVAPRTAKSGGSSKIPPGYTEVLIGKRVLACPPKGRCIPIRP